MTRKTTPQFNQVPTPYNTMQPKYNIVQQPYNIMQPQYNTHQYNQ
jgi:hypothetical protein